jgi:predicted alpha/beta superfamily hydrolase
MMRAAIYCLSLFCMGLLAGCNDDKQNPIVPKASTTQANVSVLSESFLIEGLQRERTIRVYLPPAYAESDKHYPVLYMHDGQNLFDDATAYAGEWGIDETLNELAETKGLELIVVGIDNGGEKRMNELSPWTNEEFGEAEGEQYMDFVVEQLKPFIDSHYLTKPQREYTAIMGSSMGGLISHYAIHQYPQVFSKAGIFSPSFWYASEVYQHTQQHPLPHDGRLYYLVGSAEGGSMVDDMTKMVEQISAQRHPAENIHSKVVAGAQHNENFWRSEFSEAVQWLFRD